MDTTQQIERLSQVAAKGEDINKAKLEESRVIIKDLLSSEQGIDALSEMSARGSLARQALLIVAEQSSKCLSQEDGGVRIMRLLKELIISQPSNSPALWCAVAAYCDSDQSDAAAVLKQTLVKLREPLREAGAKYEQYAYAHLRPDGGIPGILRLFASASENERKWLGPMAERAALKAMQSSQSPADDTLTALSVWLKSMARGRPAWEELDRRLLMLAVKGAKIQPELRQLLETLHPQLARHGGDAWAITRTKVQEALGIADEPPTATASKEERVPQASNESEAESHSPPEATKESIAIVLTDSVAEKTANTESDSLRTRLSGFHKAALAETELLEETLRTLEQLEEKVGAFSKVELALRSEIRRLNQRNEDLIREGNSRQEQYREAQRELREVKQKMQAALQQATVAEGRAKQDVSLARMEAESALADFRNALWQELRVYFIEAEDSAYQPQTTEERIFLGRLRDTLGVLKRHEIGMA